MNFSLPPTRWCLDLDPFFENWEEGTPDKISIEFFFKFYKSKNLLNELKDKIKDIYLRTTGFIPNPSDEVAEFIRSIFNTKIDARANRVLEIIGKTSKQLILEMEYDNTLIGHRRQGTRKPLNYIKDRIYEALSDFPVHVNMFSIPKNKPPPMNRLKLPPTVVKISIPSNYFGARIDWDSLPNLESVVIGFSKKKAYQLDTILEDIRFVPKDIRSLELRQLTINSFLWGPSMDFVQNVLDLTGFANLESFKIVGNYMGTIKQDYLLKPGYEDAKLIRFPSTISDINIDLYNYRFSRNLPYIYIEVGSDEPIQLYSLKLKGCLPTQTFVDRINGQSLQKFGLDTNETSDIQDCLPILISNPDIQSLRLVTFQDRIHDDGLRTILSDLRFTDLRDATVSNAFLTMPMLGMVEKLTLIETNSSIIRDVRFPDFTDIRTMRIISSRKERWNRFDNFPVSLSKLIIPKVPEFYGSRSIGQYLSFPGLNYVERVEFTVKNDEQVKAVVGFCSRWDISNISNISMKIQFEPDHPKSFRDDATYKIASFLSKKILEEGSIDPRIDTSEIRELTKKVVDLRTPAPMVLNDNGVMNITSKMAISLKFHDPIKKKRDDGVIHLNCRNIAGLPSFGLDISDVVDDKLMHFIYLHDINGALRPSIQTLDMYYNRPMRTYLGRIDSPDGIIYVIPLRSMKMMPRTRILRVFLVDDEI